VTRSTQLLLQFDPRMPKAVRSALVGGLSCAVRIGDTLWTASDETCHVERLQPLPGTASCAQRWGQHTRFALADYLPLAIPARRRNPLAVPEADLEGLAYREGYLWVLGSHSRLRGEADRATTVENLRALATIERDGNRYLLARIPVIVDHAGTSLARNTGKGTERHTAACVRNNAKGSRLTRLLARDAHFGPFVALPGKENGLDCEGLAVGAGGRVFVGLRGPVLDGWAGLIELRVATDPEDHTRLSLRPIPGSGKPPYRKHFLDLDGRGVRDLLLDGADLLILAGPTMGNSGSFAVFRWRGGARVRRASLVRGDRLEKLLDLPDDGRNDHPEGIAAWPAAAGGRARLLVLYERAAKDRQRGPAAVLADVYVL
jgi:hypothetical protein